MERRNFYHRIDHEVDMEWVKRGYFRAEDGTRLFYEDIQPPESDSLPPLVFCYGLVCSELHWQHQKKYFSKNRRVIWMDYRGHHNSCLPKNLGTMKLPQLVDDLALLFKVREIPPAVVCGHSLGVQIVLDFAHRYPQHTKGLVLANGAARNPLENMFHTNSFDLLVPWVEKGMIQFPKTFEKFWRSSAENRLNQFLIKFAGFNPTLVAAGEVEQYLHLASTLPFPVFLQLLKEMKSFDAVPWLDQLSVPSLVVAGENDLVIPTDGQKLMAKLLPNSKYVEVPMGSHCPQMDRPGYFNQAMSQFLDEYIH